MDPVQKAVINHTFGVSIPPKKKQVISCNVCQLRFNSDVSIANFLPFFLIWCFSLNLFSPNNSFQFYLHSAQPGGFLKTQRQKSIEHELLIFLDSSGMISNGMSIGDIPLDGTITFNRYCKNKCLPEVFFLKKKKRRWSRKASQWVVQVIFDFLPKETAFSCCSYVLADMSFHFWMKSLFQKLSFMININT